MSLAFKAAIVIGIEATLGIGYREVGKFAESIKLLEDAKIRSERGALRMIIVICRERRLEVVSRRLELSDTQQCPAHRMMRFAETRRVRCASGKRLLGSLARSRQVTEHVPDGERNP